MAGNGNMIDRPGVPRVNTWDKTIPKLISSGGRNGNPTYAQIPNPDYKPPSTVAQLLIGAGANPDVANRVTSVNSPEYQAAINTIQHREGQQFSLGYDAGMFNDGGGRNGNGPQFREASKGGWYTPSSGGGWLGDIGGALGGLVGGVGDLVSSVGKPIENTVNAIAKDPLPTIITAVLVANGINPALANGLVSAAGGASLEQSLTNAATSYVGGKAGEAASSWTAGQVSGNLGRVASAAAGGAASGATMAGLSGRDILQGAVDGGLKSGTTAGLQVGAKSLGSLIDEKFGTSSAASGAGIGGKTIGQNITSGLNFALNPVQSTVGWVADELALPKDWKLYEGIKAGMGAASNINNANRKTVMRPGTFGPTSTETAGATDYGFTSQNIASKFDMVGDYTPTNVDFLLQTDNAGTQTAGQKAAAGGKTGSTDRADPNKLTTVVGGRYSGDSAQGFNTFGQSSNDNQWTSFYG